MDINPLGLKNNEVLVGIILLVTVIISPFTFAEIYADSETSTTSGKYVLSPEIIDMKQKAIEKQKVLGEIEQAGSWAAGARIRTEITPAKLYESRVKAYGGTYVPKGQTYQPYPDSTIKDVCSEQDGCAAWGSRDAAERAATSFVAFSHADTLMQYQAAAESTKWTVRQAVRQAAQERGVELSEEQMDTLTEKAVESWAPGMTEVAAIYTIESVGFAFSSLAAGGVKAGRLAGAIEKLEKVGQIGKGVTAGKIAAEAGEIVLINSYEVSTAIADLNTGKSTDVVGTAVGIAIGDGALGTMFKFAAKKEAKVVAAEIASEAATEAAAKKTVPLISKAKTTLAAAEKYAEESAEKATQNVAKEAIIDPFTGQATIALANPGSLMAEWFGDMVGTAAKKGGTALVEAVEHIATVGTSTVMKKAILQTAESAAIVSIRKGGKPAIKKGSPLLTEEGFLHFLGEHSEGKEHSSLAHEDCNPSKQQCISSDYEYNPLIGEETYTYYPTSECNVQSGKCTPLEMTYDPEGEVLSYSLNGEVLTYSPDGDVTIKPAKVKIQCGALDFNCRLREIVDSKGKEKQGAICG